MNCSKICSLVIGLSYCIMTASGCAPSKYATIKGSSDSVMVSSRLDHCDDFERSVMAISPDREVIILVHGCKASSSRFSTLKHVFDAQNQQTICFNYDYRDRMETVSRELIETIHRLSTVIGCKRLTVIGHSQGGLISRRALITGREDGAVVSCEPDIRLVTISAPFNGIESSSPCGRRMLHVITAGITVAVCQGIAGSIWREIHPAADFITRPGFMAENIAEHLKIITDEQGICRQRGNAGTCIESDFVFSVQEQNNPSVDADPRVVNVTLKAGHALVIGTSGNPP